MHSHGREWAAIYNNTGDSHRHAVERKKPDTGVLSVWSFVIWSSKTGRTTPCDGSQIEVSFGRVLMTGRRLEGVLWSKGCSMHWSGSTDVNTCTNSSSCWLRPGLSTVYHLHSINNNCLARCLLCLKWPMNSSYWGHRRRQFQSTRGSCHRWVYPQKLDLWGCSA